jgi:hypothetical protein
VGERRWVLRSLLSQDHLATLSWLAGEARRWAEIHQRWKPVTGAIADLWSARAAAAGSLISEALVEADERTVTRA